MKEHELYDHFRRRYKRQSDDFPWDLDDKLLGKAFADRFGVAIPETFSIAKTTDEVRGLEIPDRAVVKPNGLHSARGAFALVSIGNDRYLDVLGSKPRVISREHIINNALQNWDEWKRHNRNIPFSYVVEDFVVSPLGDLVIPLDVKVYFFNKEPSFILVINRNFQKPRFGMWKPNWESAVDLIEETTVSITQERVHNPEAILSSAQRLANEVNTPFVSVDLLDAEPSVVFGEFTPAPGGPFAWAIGNTGYWRFKDDVLDGFLDKWNSFTP